MMERKKEKIHFLVMKKPTFSKICQLKFSFMQGPAEKYDETLIQVDENDNVLGPI